MTDAADALRQLGQEIETHRRQAGLTAAELAARVRISPTYMRSIERGFNSKTKRPSRPSDQAIQLIAMAVHGDAERWLKLAGYDVRSVRAAHGAVLPDIGHHVREIASAAERVKSRGSFVQHRTLQLTERLAIDLRLAAAGTVRCGPSEEPQLTRMALESCQQSLRAVSYQDEGWWLSSKGDRYLDLHEELRDRGVSMTRIFVIEDVRPLRPTLARHVAIGITTIVVSKELIPEEQWRDIVIYDDNLVRTADATDPENDRKLAEFTEDPARVSATALEFEQIMRYSLAVGAEAEVVLEGHIETEV